jgi:hypothetical protein
VTSATVPTTAKALARRKPPAAVRRRRFLLAVANHSLLIVAAIAFLAPFVFIALTALMTNSQALSSHIWPHPFRWQNFVDVFHQAPIWRWALNTMIYSCLATLGVLVSSIPVAYALSRIRWRGRNIAFGTVLIALMLPPVVSVVPLYVMWAKLGLVGGLGVGAGEPARTSGACVRAGGWRGWRMARTSVTAMPSRGMGEGCEPLRPPPGRIGREAMPLNPYVASRHGDTRAGPGKPPTRGA